MNVANQSRSEAFTGLLQRHEGILHKVARAYCPVPAQRPDLIQEMTVALWRAFERYDAARPFGTWMYRISLNVAISFFRSEGRHVHRTTALEHAPELAEPIPEDPRVAVLLECIDELNPLDKALVLMHLDGYSYAEIADVLGISESNAGTKLARIKERLRRTMTAHVAKEETTNGTR
ncbi:MAG TPA: RNA polymerase sigma factor [Candidatus Baltobacteraceae bacterium]|nr:RNA polymerase sigma factor [Candidatus Baltobacteraceae bacterium]